MKNKTLEKIIIKKGVKVLKEVGYKEVNNENIFTDMIYSFLFRKMLLERKESSSEQVDNVIDGLLLRL